MACGASGAGRAVPCERCEREWGQVRHYVIHTRCKNFLRLDLTNVTTSNLASLQLCHELCDERFIAAETGVDARLALRALFNVAPNGPAANA